MSNIIRHSNIELLRIVAMIFIIAHHLLVHGMNVWENNSWGSFPILSIDALFFIGVNLFVITSGYCRIVFRWEKLVRIWLTCSLVGGIAYISHLFIDNAHFGKSVLFNTLFSISNAPGTWYIQIYIFLMLLSPMINTALDYMTKKQLSFLVVVLTVISVYFGWFWENKVNQDGYNLINFIWLYVIGYYLKNHWDINRYKAYVYISVSIFCAILHATLFLLHPPYIAWTYNNPLIVISSISFFLFMVSFNFQNSRINEIAKSTLVVYLIHENSYVSSWLYKSHFNLWYSQNLCYFTLAVIGIYVCCILVDSIFIRNIIESLIKYLYPRLRCFVQK